MHTTASVANGWTGTTMESKSLFGVKSHCVTDGPTDGQSHLYSRVYATKNSNDATDKLTNPYGQMFLWSDVKYL